MIFSGLLQLIGWGMLLSIPLFGLCCGVAMCRAAANETEPEERGREILERVRRVSLN